MTIFVAGFGSRQEMQDRADELRPRSQSGSTARSDRDTAGGSNCWQKARAASNRLYAAQSGFVVRGEATWTFGARQTTGGEMTCATCSTGTPRHPGQCPAISHGPVQPGHALDFLPAAAQLQKHTQAAPEIDAGQGYMARQEGVK